jgi:hypothetical protein
MRGVFSDQSRLFSYISPEARVPANHPLRKIRNLVRDVLGELDRSLSRLYAPTLPQGGQAGGEALLHGPRHDGEPAWAGGCRHGHARHRHR